MTQTDTDTTPVPEVLLVELDEALRRADRAELSAAQFDVLARLHRRARCERSCPACVGHGWSPVSDEPRYLPAAQVRVCRCPAGERFWALCLDHTDAVLALMDLDADGCIASTDGLYGRFGANDRRLLRAIALTDPTDQTKREPQAPARRPQ